MLRPPGARRLSPPPHCPEEGVAHRWERDLGGFRRAPSGSPDTVWRNAPFRGRAGHTRTPEFVTAMDALPERAARERTAVMCGGAVWWRCHRRLVHDDTAAATSWTGVQLGSHPPLPDTPQDWTGSFSGIVRVWDASFCP
ncbi:hypothetical protein SUDANB176_00529 [Streptomyces sp. enrichment culture]|uniref:DUF488 family protein n=1 Tax=Streptomyces sp. enrichment culture TaxID=1795815 RepID=UPI003F5640C9